MLDMDDYLQIRLLHRDGISARQIAKRLGHGRDTIRKALLNASPPPYTRKFPRECPKLTSACQGVIDQILKDDEAAPRKQRHTARRVFDRLVEEHDYTGGYDQVRRYITAHRLRERETHLFLDHPPGGRLECDFGHIHVDFPDGRRPVPVLLCVWSFSQYSFAIALPDETTASVLHGLVLAFEFFGCVPLEVWWDNPKTVAVLVLKGRDRRLNPHYAALASHYRFAPLFCMPEKGQEKSDVERTVFALQRRFATPVPQATDMDALNRHLLMCCLKERHRRVRGRGDTIGVMFAAERAHATEVPARPFDPSIQHVRQADKYQTVLFDRVRYSVPRQIAFQSVTVKAYLDQIVIVHKGQIVARQRRGRVSGEQVLDPIHYLSVLGRKPVYLDKSRLLTDWKLPPVFARLREVFDQRYGPRTGTRHYIRVLQLLSTHPQEVVCRAIEACIDRSALTAQIIADRLEVSPTTSPAARLIPEFPNVYVPPPDLRRFNQLLVRHSSQGEPNDRTATEAQPQGTAPADDTVGVRQAVA
ncbi:MAG: transposase [Phycisphaerae bacterium]|jgi:transposase|nr:MAG: transposase [Phycisphaerae bacterium]